MKRLNAEEVKNLPDGTKVHVKWTGGNGPHWYEMTTDKFGTRRISWRDPHTKILEEDVFGESVDLAFIGMEPMHTCVETEA